MKAEEILQRVESEINRKWLPRMKEHGVNRILVSVAYRGGISGAVYYRMTAQLGHSESLSMYFMPYSDELYRQPGALRLRDTMEKCDVLCGVLDRRIVAWKSKLKR